MKKIAMKNDLTMTTATGILPAEFKNDANFGNYLLKEGTYTY